MNTKLKAAGETATFVAITFGSVSFLNWMFPIYANVIIAAGLMLYLIYLVYSIRLSTIEADEKYLTKTDGDK